MGGKALFGAASRLPRDTSPDTPKQTSPVVSVEEINSHDSQSEPALFSSFIHVFLYVSCSIKSVLKTMKAVVWDTLMVGAYVVRTCSVKCGSPK